MKKIVKWILIALIVIACVIGGVYYYSLPMEVSVVQMKPHTAELYFMERGVAAVERTVEVYAFMSGKIESLPAAENQSINEGDIICVVDSSDLAYQIIEMEGSIRGYRAQASNLDEEERKSKDSLIISKSSLLGELRALEAQKKVSSITTEDQIWQREEKIRLQGIVIAQNEKDLERAKTDMETYYTLYSAGVASESEYTDAVKTVELQESLLSQNLQQMQIIESGEVLSDEEYYEGTMESIQAQIAGIDSSLTKSYTGAMKQYYNVLIENSRAAVEQLNKKIADCSVKAPVGGVITTLYIKDTNAVATGQPVAVITPDVSNNIEVYVTTNDIEEISLGQKVDLILKRRGGDKIYEGEIKEIGGEAEVKLSVLGVEERRVKVTVTPRGGQDEIKKGFDADVKFNIYYEDNKLTVPKTALFKVNDRDMLWTVWDGKAVMTEVTKGRELRTEFVIESGLTAGDLVIIDADTAGLKEGGRVKGE